MKLKEALDVLNSFVYGSSGDWVKRCPDELKYDEAIKTVSEFFSFANANAPGIVDWFDLARAKTLSDQDENS